MSAGRGAHPELWAAKFRKNSIVIRCLVPCALLLVLLCIVIITQLILRLAYLPKKLHVLETTDVEDGSCDMLSTESEGAKSNSNNNCDKARGCTSAVITYSNGAGAKSGHYCKVQANHCAYASLSRDTECIDNRNLEKCVSNPIKNMLHLVEPAAWAKVVLLQECCRRYRHVLWLDADILIMNGSKYPVEKFAAMGLKRGFGIVMTKQNQVLAPFNSGIISVRCSGGSDDSIVHEFLSETLKGSRQGEYRWFWLWEQGVMARLYRRFEGYRSVVHALGPQRETQCNPANKLCSANEFAVHFHCCSRSYQRFFLRYFCHSKMRSKVLERMYRRVCTA